MVVFGLKLGAKWFGRRLAKVASPLVGIATQGFQAPLVVETHDEMYL